MRPAKAEDAEAVARLFFGAKRAAMPYLPELHSDLETFAWIADVFVVAEHRGRGLGKRLVEEILAHPELRVMGRWLLGTADAHGLYSRFGFEPLERTERFMARERAIDGDASASGGEQRAERMQG